MIFSAESDMSTRPKGDGDCGGSALLEAPKLTLSGKILSKPLKFETGGHYYIILLFIWIDYLSKAS